MRPLRMCMVCRERKEKSDLIRVACMKEGAPYIDLSGKGEGRGMYLCRQSSCLQQAEKRRVIERTFSCKTEKRLYAELLELAEEKE